MKINVYNKPFGKDPEIKRIRFSKCACDSHPQFINTGLEIFLYKKVLCIDFQRKCKDCDAPF